MIVVLKQPAKIFWAKYCDKSEHPENESKD